MGETDGEETQGTGFPEDPGDGPPRPPVQEPRLVRAPGAACPPSATSEGRALGPGRLGVEGSGSAGSHGLGSDGRPVSSPFQNFGAGQEGSCGDEERGLLKAPL